MRFNLFSRDLPQVCLHQSPFLVFKPFFTILPLHIGNEARHQLVHSDRNIEQLFFARHLLSEQF